MSDSIKDYVELTTGRKCYEDVLLVKQLVEDFLNNYPFCPTLSNVDKYDYFQKYHRLYQSERYLFWAIIIKECDDKEYLLNLSSVLMSYIARQEKFANDDNDPSMYNASHFYSFIEDCFRYRHLSDNNDFLFSKTLAIRFTRYYPSIIPSDTIATDCFHYQQATLPERFLFWMIFLDITENHSYSVESNKRIVDTCDDFMGKKHYGGFNVNDLYVQDHMNFSLVSVENFIDYYYVYLEIEKEKNYIKG